MHDHRIRARARELMAAGESVTAVAASLGLAPQTVSNWRRSMRTDDDPPPRCPICSDDGPTSELNPCYGYLLGQYLGDGHLVTRARVPVLRVYATVDYPNILAELRRAVQTIRGRHPATLRASHTERMVTVQSYWKHWPCVLPQHGPGMKHTREIALTDWQRTFLTADPWPLIRGLIHSDGCRAINRVTRRGTRYEYPRYFFSNESRDILAIMGTMLDLVGVSWRLSRPNCLSVARREAVATMDAHIGPKR
jgi:hypothetical protein